MPLLDDINRLLRDHTGYTGDGQGGVGPLPVGDRSTARFPINKRDLRELLIGVAQSMGDPSALDEILDQLDEKAALSALNRLGVIPLTDIGGTANAITASIPASVAADGVTLNNTSTVSFTPSASNTGSPVTLFVAGDQARPLRGEDGGDIPAGYLKASRFYIAQRFGANWKIISGGATFDDLVAISAILDGKADFSALRRLGPVPLISIGGTGDAITATIAPQLGFTTLVLGQVIVFTAAATNTGPATITINDITYNILPGSGAAATLPADTIISGRHYQYRVSVVGSAETPGSLRPVTTAMGDIPGLLLTLQNLNENKADQADLEVEVEAREMLADEFDKALPVSTPSPRMVPLHIDADDKVPVWLNDGDLDARGMAPGLRDKAVADVAPKVRPGLLKPILGAGGKVAMWADAEGLVIPGMARKSDIPVLPARSTISDDRGLHRLRTMMARLRTGVAGNKVKIVGIGDSWWEMPPITRAFRDICDDKVGLAGEGFRPVTGGNNVVGTGSWTRSGWTDIDGSQTSAFPYGAGPDGNCAWTNGTDAAMTLTGAVATEFHIYDFQHGGTWRYRIDGGAWVEVTSDASGDFRITSATGLADGSHTLEIDTTGNSGIVSMAGIYSTRAGVSGIEVLKIGNGGTTGYRMAGYTHFMTAPLAHMQPDVAVVILGTNDYRNAASPPFVYLSALQDMVSACRAAVPDMGFVFVIPPQSNGIAINPLSAYRDILAPWVEAEGHAMISMLDRWPNFDTSNGHGLWNDDLHLSYPFGATVLASDILTNLILKGA